MRKLGISVYPERSSLEECLAYVDKAAKYGFKRIFTCLLSVKEEKEAIVETFSALCERAHKYGMEVAVDTHPAVFEKLGATPFDISPFKTIGVDIIRLDGHFGDYEDVEITKNPYGIKIEYNSSCSLALDMMIHCGANKDNMCLCSNFYPQRNTGMGLERYKELLDRYLPLGLDNASFVTSRQPHTHGPWEVYDGLPTLEIHRDLPIDVQVRHLNALGYCKDIIIGNAFASEEELESMGSIDLSKIIVKMDATNDLSDVEKEIITFDKHSSRDDANDLIVRSSLPRMVFKGRSIPERKCEKEFYDKGDVLIVNDNLEHYRGELQIVLKPIRVSNTYNLVGHLDEAEQLILDCIKPRYSFKVELK